MLDEYKLGFIRADLDLQQFAVADEPLLERILNNLNISALGLRVKFIKECKALRGKHQSITL